MTWFHPSTLLDKVFEGGLLIKGIEGLAEFTGGLLLLFVSPTSIHRFLVLITQQELNEDPHDKLAHFILHSADSLNASNKYWLIAFLWIHAAIKLIAVIGLLRNLSWAYPFSFIGLGLLLAYQLYVIYEKVSIGMILLSIFDVFVLVLIWREYDKFKRVHNVHD